MPWHSWANSSLSTVGASKVRIPTSYRLWGSLLSLTGERLGPLPKPRVSVPSMATKTELETRAHSGRLIARVLRARGVERLFTLSGGHLFSIYDGCRAEGVGLVDVRHEQTAAFAAEGWAKVTREVGVCALTAGPGVTNGMSALAAASQNGSPMVVLGGRAPAMRWGQGSLQEIDHVPLVVPVTKMPATA